MISAIDELEKAAYDASTYYDKDAVMVVSLSTAIAIVERLERLVAGYKNAETIKRWSGDPKVQMAIRTPHNDLAFRRVAELELQVATLTAENERLKEEIIASGQDAYDVYEDQRERIASPTAALEKARELICGLCAVGNVPARFGPNNWKHAIGFGEVKPCGASEIYELAALGEPREGQGEEK